MKTYKGTDKNMKCKGFQYELGKEYEEEKADICNCGFHACEFPMDVFGYYAPADSRYFEADLDANDQTESDSKRVGKKIQLLAELGIAGIVKASVEYIKENVDWENSKESNTGDSSAATNTGYRSAATNTGYRSAATASGKDSVALSMGIESMAGASIGSYIVLAEWEQDSDYEWHIKNLKSAKIDGEILKPDIFYTLKNGEFVEMEVDENE